MAGATPERRWAAWRVVVVMVALIAVTQLISFGLQRQRPVPDTPMLSSAPALVDVRAPMLGRADAAVTIILFSDYACPACRALHRDLRAVAAASSDVRIVYRDWPILGERSRVAARFALASVAQGRHAAFDDALMTRGRGLSDADLQAAARRAGVDWPRLQVDLVARGAQIDALLDDSDRLARGLAFVGTPTVVIGPYVITGGASRPRLDDLVAQARRVERSPAVASAGLP